MSYVANAGALPRSTLIAESGRKVPELPWGPALFLDKTAVAFGPSKTGKTVIVKNIMKTLTGHVDQVLVVAPSEPSNRSYEGFVDAPLIHYRLFLADPKNPKKDDGAKGAMRFLEAIWKRQEMMAAIYTRANDLKTLAALFGRLPKQERAEGMRHVDAINKKRVRVIDRVRRLTPEAGRREERVKEVNEKFKTMLALIYKKYIAAHYEKLWDREDLTEDEAYSLCYLHFNPRLLLIFDDCAAQLKPFFNKDIFRLLFYQNRHSFISVIICCQDDTDLPTNLRKNAFTSFFTEQIVCLSNFDRASNKFPKNVKQYVGEVAGDVFQGHRKLVYIREDDRGHHFYHVTLPYPKAFKFGSGALQELCEQVRSAGVSMDRENPYFDRFRVQRPPRAPRRPRPP